MYYNRDVYTKDLSDAELIDLAVFAMVLIGGVIALVIKAGV
jgi:hypothetical protein